MKLRRIVIAVCLLVAVGCEKDAPPPSWPPGQPPPGYAGWGQPPPYGYPPGGQPPPYGAPAPTQPPPSDPIAMLGAALTPFGVLLAQLPQIPQQLPPLPTLEDMLRSWPFPWNQPPGSQPPSGPAPQPGPSPAPSGGWPGEWVGFEDEVLRQTNARRAVGANCGGKPFGPAGPVGPHAALRNSARGHSQDMANRGFFDHRTPEGVGPMQRAQRAGYDGGFVGENIAAGHRSAGEVVQGWMDSPGHCVNVMEPRYRFLGVGYFFRQGDRFGHYWTQNFGG